MLQAGSGSDRQAAAWVPQVDCWCLLCCCKRILTMCWRALQGKVVWQGTNEEFDSTQEPIVRQFRSGDLNGPIRYD